MDRKRLLITFFTVIVSVVFGLFIVNLSLKTEIIVNPQDSQSLYIDHKTIPLVVEPEIVKALSFYPELKNTRIDFIFVPNIKKAVMQAQPLLGSILKGRAQREYVIKINPFFKLTNKSLPIQSVPKEILVGWFGHELGHVTDYTHKTNFQMAVFGIKYLCSDSFVMKAERAADTYAVNHGLGENLIKTKNFILHHADIPAEYKERIKKLYLSPEQIMKLVKKLEKKA